MKPYYRDEHVTVYHADCLDLLAALPDNSVHAVVTDPPYGLEFMGRELDSPWKHCGAVVRDPAVERGGFQDASGGNPYSRSRIEYGRGGEALIEYQRWCTDWAKKCLRILKPGGHFVAFGGTRTYHRLACAVEDAGMELRDSIAWLHGQGFPKNWNVSKAIDRQAGVDRSDTRTTPATEAAKQWAGWGTALKPAFEPIVLARKAFRGSVATNVQACGTGALNIDRCRVVRGGAETGRWPTNVAIDEAVTLMLNEPGKTANIFPAFRWLPKADTSERPTNNGLGHPTVKPVSLVRWLCRLVCPPGGTVLEPFAGSGTTVQAARAEGLDVVAVERDAEYLPLIKQRLERVGSPVNTSAWPGHVAQPGQSSLFDLLGGDAA